MNEKVKFIERKKYNSKYINFEDLYRKYNYPCWEKTNVNTVPRPYIPKDLLKCDHKFTLTFSEWKKILYSLFKYMLIYLMTGKNLKLPHSLGYLQIRKWKPKKYRKMDYAHWRKTGEIRYENFKYTQDYSPILKWHKGVKKTNFNFATYWRINFMSSAWKKIASTIEKNPSFIYKFNDI